MTYDNTNRGVLRSNERKEKEAQPDMRGDINIDGKEYWLSGWKKHHEKMGGEYFSLSVQPKEKVFKEAKKAVDSAAPIPQAPFDEDEGDQIPF